MSRARVRNFLQSIVKVGILVVQKFLLLALHVSDILLKLLEVDIAILGHRIVHVLLCILSDALEHRVFTS